MRLSHPTILPFLSLIGSVAYAQSATYCLTADPAVCYSLSTAKSSTDIFIQLSAPATYSWIGMGTGTRMAGSTMFLMYAQSTDNVTVSPRTAKGHFQPSVWSEAQVSVEEGTGIEDGNMRAVVTCSNCQDAFGALSATTPFICAYKKGDPLNTADTAASIDQHDGFGRFTLDLTQATSNSNPFTGKGTPPLNSTTSSGQQGEGGDGNTALFDKLHGVFASVAFVICFPLGTLLIRKPGTKGGVWVHAAFQIFTMCIAFAGMGLGIKLAKMENVLFDQAHTIIGVMLIILLSFQPILGYIHHRKFRAVQKRTLWSFAHVWYGRALIALGIINGGLGLQLAANTMDGEIVYGVVAGVVGLIYIAVILLVRPKRPKI